MIIHDISKITKRGKTYLQASIDRNGKPRKICYIAVSEKYSEYVTDDATPFLAALYLPAMKMGEDIYIDGSISQQFFNSLPSVISLVTPWPLGYTPIAVTALHKTPDRKKNGRIGLFFSGGVDSWYSLRMNKKRAQSAVTDFIFVHGFDIPLKEKQFYSSVRKEVEYVAGKAHVRFIPVETNMREVIDPMLEWDYSHGGALAAVGLALRGGIGRVYLSGGMETAATRPYGMHPALDPLWSSEGLRVVHFGDKARRIEKIEAITKDPLVLETLRVCWRNKKGLYNCCECEKCLRTMLVLYSLGLLNKCVTFPKPLDPDRIRKTHLYPNQIRYFQESLDVLHTRGKNDVVAEAIQECLNRNRTRSQVRGFTVKIRQEFGKWDSQYNNGRFFYALSRAGVL